MGVFVLCSTDGKFTPENMDLMSYAMYMKNKLSVEKSRLHQSRVSSGGAGACPEKGGGAGEGSGTQL